MWSNESLSETYEDLTTIGQNSNKRITFHEDQLPDIEDEGVSLKFGSSSKDLIM